MITEHLMRPGSGSIQFRSDVPPSITDQIRKWVDENYGSSAVGAHIVITNAPLTGIDSASDAYILATALYTGVITARPSRTSLEFTGIGSWLDTYIETDTTRSSGTPSQWVGDLVKNGITAGTVTATGLSNVSRTFPAYAQTYRQALDAWAGLAGAEYRIMPDFTVDAATEANLFDSGSVIVTKKNEGPDGVYRGVDGGLLDQALTQLGPNLATKAIALAEGDGLSIATGSDTQSLNLKTQSNGTPVLVKVFSAPSEESANANTAATSFLNLQGMRRAINISSSTYHLPRLVVPGDTVYVWDVDAGLYDTSNEVEYRGETIHPASVRLLSYTWPIEADYGVYIRSSESTPTYLDVSDFVEREDGDTWWTVGDWSPPSYGPVNRTNPEIEERVSDPGALTWSPTITQSSAVSGTVNRGWYVKRPDGTFTAQLKWTASASGASAILTVSSPVTLANAEDVGGDFTLNNGSTNVVGRCWNAGGGTTSFKLVVNGASGSYSTALASGHILYLTVTGRYA